MSTDTLSAYEAMMASLPPETQARLTEIGARLLEHQQIPATPEEIEECLSLPLLPPVPHRKGEKVAILVQKSQSLLP